MARPTTRAALSLSDEDRSMLSELAGSRTAAQREVERAKVLLGLRTGQVANADWAHAGRVTANDLQVH